MELFELVNPTGRPKRPDNKYLRNFLQKRLRKIENFHILVRMFQKVFRWKLSKRLKLKHIVQLKVVRNGVLGVDDNE